jgi:anaerobic selenocysteine-containing dehydrogenase
MTKQQKHVMCRSCHAHCGLVVDFEDGLPTATHGDKDNPAFAGFSCIKGRRLVNHHTLPSRLLSSKKRGPDGQHYDIHWQDAAAEMAEKLQGIIAEHGPDSVAMYIGTFGYNNLNAHAYSLALMDAMGSAMKFTSVTIDQPGKGYCLVLPWTLARRALSCRRVGRIDAGGHQSGYLYERWSWYEPGQTPV